MGPVAIIRRMLLGLIGSLLALSLMRAAALSDATPAPEEIRVSAPR